MLRANLTKTSLGRGTKSNGTLLPDRLVPSSIRVSCKKPVLLLSASVDQMVGSSQLYSPISYHVLHCMQKFHCNLLLQTGQLTNRRIRRLYFWYCLAIILWQLDIVVNIVVNLFLPGRQWLFVCDKIRWSLNGERRPLSVSFRQKRCPMAEILKSTVLKGAGLFESWWMGVV